MHYLTRLTHVADLQRSALLTRDTTSQHSLWSVILGLAVDVDAVVVRVVTKQLRAQLIHAVAVADQGAEVDRALVARVNDESDI